MNVTMQQKVITTKTFNLELDIDELYLLIGFLANAEIDPIHKAPQVQDFGRKMAVQLETARDSLFLNERGIKNV